MSKIICDVCGTSYPDAASQCPICGYVKSASENSFSENDESAAGTGYTYVKGGRFSKANVRKRAKSAPVEEIDEYDTSDDSEPEEKRSDAPLVITAIILLVAIAAIVVFITLRFFGPWAGKNREEEPVQTATTTEQTTDDGLIPCTKLEVSDTQIDIPEGGFYELKVIKEPADTTDQVIFASKDPAIATVDDNGKITPVSTGSTTITITCGTEQIELQVSCQVKEEVPFILDQMELKLEYQDQEWILYSGEIPVADIEFSSDDETIATFVDGVVYAKAPGETVVYAKYEDQTVSCKVSCVFEQEQDGSDDHSDDNTVTEDGSTEQLLTHAPKATGTKGYQIRTNFGATYVDSTNPADFDTSHYVGYELTFRLVDANGISVNAKWKVYNTSICKLKTDGGSTVVCLEKGNAYIVATTEDGETYVCTIRVS